MRADEAYWKNASDKAGSKYLALIAFGIYAGLRMARDPEVETAMEARMDGTTEQQLLWRVSALREALTDLATTDGVARQIARNALAVDDHNAETMRKQPAKNG